MICPNCSNVDEQVEVPKFTPKGSTNFLGICSSCNTKVYCIPSQKNKEKNKNETVKKGESREVVLAKKYIKAEGGIHLEKQERFADIDFLVRDNKKNDLYYLEIKERSNTINAYRYTKFPYAKIDEGIRLIKEKNIPVFIVLKFKDCWSRIKIDPNKTYIKGEIPFTPNYRNNNYDQDHQKPVKIHVHQLEVLNWN